MACISVGSSERVQPRYNLATKVMSNGVEVIVANSRSARPGEPEFLRLLSSTVTRPITLAPHTLSHHMSMVLHTDDTYENNHHLRSSLHPTNTFLTNTYYTTYTYPETAVVDGQTETSSEKLTVTNVKTEENTAKSSNHHVSLSTTPTLQTNVYQTAYTYLNTILDGEQPLVMTSSHTVKNTVVAAEELLEPSEVFPATNTYMKTVGFTKTVTDGTDSQVVSTKDVVTQVVITDKPERTNVNQPVTTDVTKTYFVTYTYFSTYLDDGQTKIKSDVSVSSDVTVEKFYVKPKKTATALEKSTRVEAAPLNILATKVYLTTFTYFTTLLQGTVGGKGETKVSSRTKVVQNTVTESIDPSELNSKNLLELESSLKHQINNPIVTTATLKGGEKLQITAFKGDVTDKIYEKLKIKPTNIKTETSMKANQNEEEKKTKTPVVSKTKTTIKHKQKKPVKTMLDEITAEALVADSQTSLMSTPSPTLSNHNLENSATTPVSYSTTVLATSTVTAQGATLLPGEQVIVLHDTKGEVTLIPVSDHQKKQENKNPGGQVNDVLSMGINGINVLGPVFNAMAELLNNNLNSKKNDTVVVPSKPSAPQKKTPNTNPLLSFMNSFTASTTTEGPATKTTRKPVYIPVGSFADADFGESQDAPVAVNSPVENWPDVQQKNFEKRPAMDKPQKVPIPILEGGIPISPGQVITTNSDVIIGRPGGSGPRPPNFALKNNVPFDMRPPPPPLSEEPQHDTVGQHSTHQGVDPEVHKEEELDMMPPPPPPEILHEPHQHPNPPHQHPNPPHQHPNQPHQHPNQQHQHPNQPHLHPNLPHHQHPNQPHQHPNQPHQHPNQPHQHPNQPHLHPNLPHHQHPNQPHHQHQHPSKAHSQSHHPHHHHHPHTHNSHHHTPKQPSFNYDSGAIDLNPPPFPPQLHHPIEINHKPHEIVSYKPEGIPAVLPIPVHLGPQENVANYVNPVNVRPDSLGQLAQSIEHAQRGQDAELAPSIQFVKPSFVQMMSGMAPELLSTQIIDRSSGNPVLVNIQPSQVANVVIPHGSSTALIISAEQQHSLKGEVIDDPKPHPEPETVGFVAEPVLKIENSDLTQNEIVPVIHHEPVLPDNRPFYRPDPVQVRPRPDYDNIGMQPPPEPRPYQPSPIPAPPTVAHPAAPTIIHGEGNIIKAPTGMYVDISPPGHLPPPHAVQPVQLPQQPRPDNINDNLSNHQTGLVHDVPLNAQVQLGSGPSREPALKEILVNTKYDNVPVGSQNHELPATAHGESNYVRQHGDDIPENMSPPPPPPKEPYRPYRPPRIPLPSYPHMAQPPQYMLPPPKVPQRPPHSENRPIVIPVGAAPQAYPAPRPEEILIVPTNVRPDEPTPSENDLEVSDSNDPIQTEDGEEIQESNTRPLLPGQIPTELQHSHRDRENTSVIANKITVDEQSNIGLSQTLSFGSNNDKTDIIDHSPDFSEAETIVGSKPHTGFNSNNEAVLAVGSQSNFHGGEYNTGDHNLVFGSKLNDNEVPVSSVGAGQENTREPDFIQPDRLPPAEINEMLTPPKGKPEEVMGLSPPPLERPRRPQRPQRPKPPYKFEVPTTPPSTLSPIAIENDFPPVRSPDFNRKPLKPQDIFPPRLPDNFVHHVQEFPVRPLKPSKYPVRNQERPTVTSLPIDTPSTSTTETSTPEDINGHSKPIAVDESGFGMRPPPPPPAPSKRPKPVVHERPVLSDRPLVPERPKQPEHSTGAHKWPQASHDEPPMFEKPPPPPPPSERPHRPPFGHERPTSPPQGHDHHLPAQIQPRPTSAHDRPPAMHDRPPQLHDRDPLVNDRPPPPPDHERPPPPPPSVYDRPPTHVQDRPSVNDRPSLVHDRPPVVHDIPKSPYEHMPTVERTPSHERPVLPSRQPVRHPQGRPPLVQERPPIIHQQRPIIRPERPQRPIKPTSTTLNLATTTPSWTGPSHTKPAWSEGDVVVGSETIFDPNLFHHKPTEPTTSSRKNIITTLISTGSTTIFGDLYTDPLLLEPTKVVTSNDGLKVTMGFKERENAGAGSMVVVATKPMSLFPTHTTTLTVTTTMTTVIHSLGQKPSTKTIVLTKTLISTIVDKITETQTLVKPTTATITQTHTVSTTKTALVVPTGIYPPHPQRPSIKPEIMIADPHSKDTMTISVSSSMNKKDSRPIPVDHDNEIDQAENESILVVMTDRSPKLNMTHGHHFEVNRDETNDLNDSGLLLGGVLVANNPKDYKDVIRQTECLPECKATRNELCQKHEGRMRCVCRPGFARMFPDRPCKPTYTYNMRLALTENMAHAKDMRPGSPGYTQLAAATKEGLDRMVMQSDLRDVYHGIAVNGFQAKDKKTMVEFYVQLSENTDENRITDVFKKSLRTTNYSLGGTELYAARESDIDAEDFNECTNSRFHDCSDNARCFNIKGTYTCSCKEGFTDLSENSLFPGRVCSDMIGCEYCGYHGSCYSRDDVTSCECFQWYTGDRCRINLKVLLIALVTIGAILLALLLVCVVLTCLKRRNRSSSNSRANGSSGYLRYRGPVQSQAMDKRAMIADTSSESSGDNLPYITPIPPPPPGGTLGMARKPVLRQHAKGPAPRPMQTIPPEQRDRSLTVMIPRAKYRPVPPLTPHLTMSTFSPDRHLQRTAAQIANEQKLISYLEGSAREASINNTPKVSKTQNEYKAPSNNVNQPPRQEPKKERVFEYEYKTSNMNITDGNSSGDRRSSKNGDDESRFRRHSDSAHIHSDITHSLQHRKYSAGALVSAGYEVSATVGLRSKDDDEQSSILNSNTLKSGRSQFTTLNRTGDHKTMSEARSYDETTIQPPTRTLKTHYSGSIPSTRHHNDEGHTMVERDLGSTFLMPGSNLFRPDRDRGSDISNFDSL